MSAPAVGIGKPSVRIGGASYPVLLPSIRDPRLHLAAVIISLHVLGQTAFDFDLSIAQILISLLTAAVLEIAITFRQQKVLMWPASALLTGNGVAFILRVPGTEHGDWWSTRGWWIFAGTSAVSLLSKYVIQFRGRHFFNPSNIGLVLCFLLLGPELAEPLDFWWGPMSPALALALAIIVAGGLAILLRLGLLSIAIAFWVTFAACLAVLAASGHAMTARWHLGPVTDWDFWLVLAFSPEILVFLFFMITDPKTIPAGRAAAGLRGRNRPARGAPDRTADDRVREQGGGARSARDRLRGAAVARGPAERAGSPVWPNRVALAAVAGAATRRPPVSPVVVAGIPARPAPRLRRAGRGLGARGVHRRVGGHRAARPRTARSNRGRPGDRPPDRGGRAAATGSRPRRRRCRGSAARIPVARHPSRTGGHHGPAYEVDAVELALEPGEGQSSPSSSRGWRGR